MQDSSTILIFTSPEPAIEPPAADQIRYRGDAGDNPRYRDHGAEPRMRGPVEVARKAADHAVAVSTQTLKDSVLQAYRNCLEVIESLPAHSGDAVLESVTFSLAIDGEGQVGLLSTSAKVGAQVGLSFQVRIPAPATPPGYR